jgi:hypothetical protein
VFIISLLVLFAVDIFTTKITADVAVLTVLNAIVVTLTAMGAYEVTFAKLEK